MLTYVYCGCERVAVIETPDLPANAAQLVNGILWVGPGTDIGMVLFRLNCTVADVRWLESLKIEAP